ncbi:MAG: Polysaccharide biosynthesis protein [Bacteroidetes bacterium ADurb.Bin408]|nr:MAG: Polysaccharide biosynthesis protein [Bacteroidetes bacterium ADurb.Bin408]
MQTLFKQLITILKGQLFRSTGVYLGSSFLNSLIPFLMIPVLTRYLTPIDYGIVTMFTVLVGFVTPFTGLSVHGAIYRQYFDLDREAMNIYVTNILVILISSFCIVSVVFFLFSDQITKLSAVPREWLAAVVIVSSVAFLSQILLSLWRLEIKPFAYGIYQNIYTLTNLGLSLFFVVVLGFSWQGRIGGIVLSGVLFGFIALILLYRQNRLRFKLNLGYIKNALNFGIPMVPTALKGSLMVITDRLFITNMIGIGATGLYAAGYQMTLVIHLLTASFNNAYVPWLFGKLKLDDQNMNKNIVRFTYIYFIGIAVIALLWAIVAIWLLGFFVGPKFYDARAYVVWFSLGFAFSGMHAMVVNYIYYAQKTGRYGLISVISIGINVLLNYVLIPLNGAVGAAQAMCFTYLFTFLMTWWLSSKVHPMPWCLSCWRRDAC